MTGIEALLAYGNKFANSQGWSNLPKNKRHPDWAELQMRQHKLKK